MDYTKDHGIYQQKKTSEGRVQQEQDKEREGRGPKKYEAANREVRQNVKREKRDYCNSLETEAEEAVAHGSIKDLYDTIREDH